MHQKVSEKRIYQPPTDENGNPMFVPIVSKNKDALIGYLDAINYVYDLFDEDEEAFPVQLDSSRFNDILIDGRRLGNLTESQIKELEEQQTRDLKERDKHPDNTCSFDNKYLSIFCPCQMNLICFDSPKEVPEEDYCCDICGRKIIHYTGFRDDQFDYDG